MKKLAVFVAFLVRLRRARRGIGKPRPGGRLLRGRFLGNLLFGGFLGRLFRRLLRGFVGSLL